MVFPLLSIPVCLFLQAAIHFDSLCVVDGSEFFKPVGYHGIVFSSLALFECYSA